MLGAMIDYNWSYPTYPDIAQRLSSHFREELLAATS